MEGRLHSIDDVGEDELREALYLADEEVFDHADDDPEKARFMAMRSAGLQGGYFIVAARALGLDCGPMSGFNREGVDQEFFAGTPIKSYFLCNLGYGDHGSVSPRAARLGFDEACKIL